MAPLNAAGPPVRERLGQAERVLSAAIERRHSDADRRNRGPQLPGSACPPRPDQRHDSFSLNDRLDPDDRPFRYSFRQDECRRLGQVSDERPALLEPKGPRHRPGPAASMRSRLHRPHPVLAPNWAPARHVLASTASASNAPPSVHRTAACSATAATAPDRTVPSPMLPSDRTANLKRHRLVPTERRGRLQRHRPSFVSCPARASSSRSGSTDLSHSSDFEQIDRPGPGQRDRFLSGSIASARSVASVRSGLNWCLRSALRLRGGSAGRPNRWIGPALTAPSLEDGTGRGPALVPALEQDPTGAERIVRVTHHLDDAAKRPTPLSELRHL